MITFNEIIRYQIEYGIFLKMFSYLYIPVYRNIKPVFSRTMQYIRVWLGCITAIAPWTGSSYFWVLLYMQKERLINENDCVEKIRITH